MRLRLKLSVEFVCEQTQTTRKRERENFQTVVNATFSFISSSRKCYHHRTTTLISFRFTYSLHS
jgi:hypothetical protein